MAKNKILILLICLANALFCHSIAGNLRGNVRSTYIGQLGIREATGHNDGREVETFLSSVGLRRGQPWCAAFVFWCHKQNCIKAPRSGYSPDWFRTHIIWTRNSNSNVTPESGGVFGIYFPDKGRIAHVGFIEQWGAKWVVTVEGNTNEAGSREGDGVYKKKRLARQIYKVADYIK